MFSSSYPESPSNENQPSRACEQSGGAAADLRRIVSDGVDLAKAGNAPEVYARLKGDFQRGAIPPSSHYAFGWILYYALHQSGEKAFQERKLMLKEYLQLSLRKPHKLHSMILTEAIRLYHDVLAANWQPRESARNEQTAEEAMYVAELAEPYCAGASAPGAVNAAAPRPRFSIMAFSNLWDLKNLRDGDWKRKEYQGTPLNSTVERLITCYINEMEQTKQQPSEEFAAVIGRALREYPDSFNLMAQYARYAMAMKNQPEAVESLRKAILLAPSKFYLWSRLAMIAPASDKERLRIALLYKALKAPGPEQFKGKVRLALAEAWLRIKAYPQALHELQQMRRTYEANGWHLSGRYREVEKNIPLITEASDPLPAYRKVESMADEFIYSVLPKMPVKKNYHKEASTTPDRYGRLRTKPAAWRVADAEGRNYWLTPSVFGIDENLPVGTPLWISVYAGRVVAAGV